MLFSRIVSSIRLSPELADEVPDHNMYSTLVIHCCHPLLSQGCRGRSLPAGVWGVPQYGSNKAKVRSGLTRPEPESGESPDPVPKEVHANVQVSCAHSASAPV